jgi:hypothetical protein
MLNRNAFRIALVALIVAATMNAASQASTPLTETNNLTFRTPVALPGVTLAPGTYVFERDRNDSARMVRVKSTNYQRLYFVGFTTNVIRPRGMKGPVAFGEADAGQPIPIIAWYPVGSNEGHQFRYTR